MESLTPIYTQQGLSFDPVLPPEGEPCALSGNERGEVFVQVKAEHARQVEFVIDQQKITAEKRPEGIWRGKLPYHTGIHYIQILLDETEVLSPYLPVGYGYSRIYNYVELGEEDCFYGIKEVPHGSVSKNIYYSSVTGTWEECIVYIPAAYEDEPERQFPVLYLQHGHGENETGWVNAGKVNLIMDNLLAAGMAVPFLIVMNNGMVQTKDADGKRVVDHTLLEKRLISDVIPFIESKYRVRTDKAHRAMAGLSMGSLQTSITGFRHPEYFSALGIFSGFLHDIIQGNELDMVKREQSKNEHLRLLDDAKRFRKEFSVFFRAMGKADPYWEHFAEDDRICEDKGIPQIRKVYEGIHDWNVWRMCIRDFAQLIFK